MFIERGVEERSGVREVRVRYSGEIEGKIPPDLKRAGLDWEMKLRWNSKGVVGGSWRRRGLGGRCKD